MRSRNQKSPSNVRIGFGYDIHRFCAGRKLVLGGVHIPHPEGLLGHSDADVLLHAICDAILGGAALGDIGKHFPDSDRRYKDISSLKLLRQVGLLIKRHNLRVNNVDATLVMERPKIGPYTARMRKNIGSALGIAVNYVSVKATTNEGLGFIGREEGVAAYAVSTIVSATDL